MTYSFPMIDQVLVSSARITASENIWEKQYRFQNLSEDEQAVNLLNSFLIDYKKDLDEYKSFLSGQLHIIQSHGNHQRRS